LTKLPGIDLFCNFLGRRCVFSDTGTAHKIARRDREISFSRT
jgi:hypothetical protein